MLIDVHLIQNHSPANLNRDDLGAPKTCYFGGVLRSRISSQSIKRSIRMSEEFELLRNGVRTRQLATLIAGRSAGTSAADVEAILADCGLAPKPGKKPKKKKGEEEAEAVSSTGSSKMLVYTTEHAITTMAGLLDSKAGVNLAEAFGDIISQDKFSPDMALQGRMLETGKLKDTTVEASLQMAHAISTHGARPEVDYFIAADDIKGEDHGAGYLDEAMFASACYYKYYSIHWEGLKKNLADKGALAAHTVGAYLRASAVVSPTGKQNSYAAHNLPEGILVEIREQNMPISYANAFARPVPLGEDLIERSIEQLGQYAYDSGIGYGAPVKRIWYSMNLRHPLTVVEDGKNINVATENVRTLDELVDGVLASLDYSWADVKSIRSADQIPAAL